MIEGQVTNNLEAQISICIYASDGKPVYFSAVIDTGFTAFLTLSPKLAKHLGFTALAKTNVVLADGSESVMSMCPVTVEWHGVKRKITLLVSAGGSLIGMALLKGSKLTIDVVRGGEVIIS
jgi:clan AA aspartic protease